MNHEINGPATSRQDRITTSFNLYHERLNKDPVRIQIDNAERTETTNQSFQLEATITTSEQHVTSPIESPGKVIIHNLVGVSYAQDTRTGQILKDQECIVEVLVEGVPTFEIPPRDFFVGRFVDYSSVTLRTKAHNADVIVAVFPK